MIERAPCVYILANRHNGAMYVGVTSNLIEAQNPMWNDLTVGFGLPPLAASPGGAADPGTGPG